LGAVLRDKSLSRTHGDPGAARVAAEVLGLEHGGLGDDPDVPVALGEFEVGVLCSVEVDVVFIDGLAGLDVVESLGAVQPDRPVLGVHRGNHLVGEVLSLRVFQVVGRDVFLVGPAGAAFEDGVTLGGERRSGLVVAASVFAFGAQWIDGVVELVGARDFDQLGLGLVVAVDYVDN